MVKLFDKEYNCYLAAFQRETLYVLTSREMSFRIPLLLSQLFDDVKKDFAARGSAKALQSQKSTEGDKFLSPFQDDFSSYKTDQSVGVAKMEHALRKKNTQHIRKQNLACLTYVPCEARLHTRHSNNNRAVPNAKTLTQEVHVGNDQEKSCMNFRALIYRQIESYS